MRTGLRLLVSTGILGLGSLVLSCEGSPTRPAPNTNPPPGPPAPGAALSRIEVVAPSSIAPGTSAQLTANAIKTDGSVENVTSQSVWSSNAAGFVPVTSSGLATGTQRGEATVSARYQNRSGFARILVLPDGTFRLGGQVTEAGIVPLEGATISVIEGTGEGLTAVTSPAGSYAIYGVAGTVRLQAKKDGYANRIAETQVNGNRGLNFDLTFNGERPEIDGRYSMRVTVQGQCFGAPIPDSARSRTYIATIDQNDARLTVTLSGADFAVTNGRGNRFNGVVLSDRASFVLGDAYYYYYYGPGQFDLVERIPPDALVINGTANGTLSPSGISGTLSGVVALTNRQTAPFWPFTSQCFSQSHTFEMRRE